MILRDEVSSPKFSKMFMGRRIIGFGSLYRGLKGPKPNTLPIYKYLSAKRFIPYPGIYRNTPETGRIVGMSSLVHLILSISYQSEIVFSTVKSITIDVIYLFLRATHYQDVKIDTFAPFTTLRNSGRSIYKFPGFFSAPLKTANHIRVVIVDHCRLALSKWDDNHFLIIPNFGV